MLSTLMSTRAAKKMYSVQEHHEFIAANDKRNELVTEETALRKNEQALAASLGDAARMTPAQAKLLAESLREIGDDTAANDAAKRAETIAKLQQVRDRLAVVAASIKLLEQRMFHDDDCIVRRAAAEIRTSLTPEHQAIGRRIRTAMRAFVDVLGEEADFRNKLSAGGVEFGSQLIFRGGDPRDPHSAFNFWLRETAAYLDN